jgi:hypothetical protein
MHKINRRKALTVVAAVPFALGTPTFTTGEPGQLAALVRRYLAEWNAFNAFLVEDERTHSQPARLRQPGS